MLLHNYLRRKSDIHSRAQAEYKTLLEEIADPKMKAAVDDWQPGDKIADDYPQKDQKVEERGGPDDSGPINKFEAKAPDPTKEAADAKPPSENVISQPQSDANAQANHQPDGQTTQQEPAGGNAPA